MIAVGFYPFFTLLGAFAFAGWCWHALPRFADYINRQVYDEYCSLLEPWQSYPYFRTHSQLQARNTKWRYSFWLFFPLFAYLIDSPYLAFLLMALLYLAVLDYVYYLTDMRCLAFVFVLALAENPFDSHQVTLLFCVLLFSAIHFFCQWGLKKEALGMGDSLLFMAVSPLFPLERMLWVIFIASLSGTLYSLFYWLFTQRKLAKVPFIPFIAFSTFVMIIAKINHIFS